LAGLLGQNWLLQSAAGGIGMVALTGEDDAAVVRSIRQIKALTRRPFCINLIVDYPYEQQLKTILEEGVPIVSLFWGDLAPLVKRIHSAGAQVIMQGGSTDEAKRAVDNGVDIIAAQGWEAGGHVRGTVATLPLIPGVVEAVAPTHVVAAGGIVDGRGLAAVLALGRFRRMDRDAFAG
jgi:nitronate monooxygenase